MILYTILISFGIILFWVLVYLHLLNKRDHKQF